MRDAGGAEFAGPENDGPQKNNDWKMQALENDGIAFDRACIFSRPEMPTEEVFFRGK